MQSVLEANQPEASKLVQHKFRLIWKDPESRRYHLVGQFEALTDGRYAFGYDAAAAKLSGFHPLVQFPDLTKVYLHNSLPVFFANRVMTKRRENYAEYMGWLGLSTDAPPVEVLARTGGGRATDTFHVVDSFEPDSEGVRCGRFFVSGVRHRFRGDLSRFKPGDELTIVPEPDNLVNSRALLLGKGEVELGWVPDWLLNDVHEMLDNEELRITIERINLDAPPHLAILSKLVARPRG
ncbi:hypothetical protein [Tessaracoccus sp. OH4464_COT-324]|uniref:hypothetical protein n=1 Tax=Tessaracoccus sp. OH4464_COT-324 TaxID=2491059 RepID=UPI000F63F3DB|nr:hypothetical protein [Tessaracoccus sp. OH4464_COT-324]RRD46709.1 hypothetical protein EII42_05640 [Tessaracoccus sp. OH4464_COT-324]